ncbi:MULTISPECIES: hypothetical protein [Pseudomonas]|uniref:hypothetical protein n=1 Tax=Pseudomonas TaxID=286 RepID=UPI000D8B3054|nr:MULTISPECIES: hypothetical protein [unclassified Pseudomonas]MCK8682843.1 hypothetical protein [Pseudomonas umsongensis]MDP9687473.1 hypothetical protein [Pseudomonas mohnii]MBD0678385.1 hypothetical protein [Pseudomonas sp. PSB11]MDI3393561.1 hypothetical protein [Pseudomonas sp. V98_8]NWL20866.1 hypothetical protein [Pseudomonas umsongensis]
MKGQLLGVAATIIIIGSTVYGFNNWKAQQSQRQEAVCALARQHLKDLEVQARALAAGLSVEAYAEAEKAEAGKLVSALDTAKNEAEVDAVIDQHSAAIEAQIHAEDAEVKSRGEQKFLGQERKEQRITTDMKQEIQRAEKAVADDCQ